MDNTMVLIVAGLLVLLLAVLVLSRKRIPAGESSDKGDTDIIALYSSGVLNKGEEITKRIGGTQITDNGWKSGLAVFTNKRFVFCKKPSGWRAKGFDVVFDSSWGDVVSVTTSGTLTKKLNLTVKQNGRIDTFTFTCKNIEGCMDQIIENKNAYKDQEKIEAKTVIIEEANKDKAEEILKKRLARGEITLDEFHQKIQRT